MTLTNIEVMQKHNMTNRFCSFLISIIFYYVFKTVNTKQDNMPGSAIWKIRFIFNSFAGARAFIRGKRKPDKG